LFVDYFRCKPVGKQQKPVLTSRYAFKCDLKIHYIVEIEHHDNSIYIIKFFQKNHRQSDNKYSLKNTLNFLKVRKTSGVKNFRKILRTVTNLSLEIYKKDENSCFAFMGAPTLGELDSKKHKHKKYKSKVNPDGTVRNTRRYKIYRTFVSNTFDPKDFVHYDILSSSCYLLKSPKNQLVTREYTEEFFKNYFINFA